MLNKRPKILIIDDTPANVKLLGEALTKEYELKFALSGTVGLQIAAQLPLPDLILLDVLMPGMDGYQTCSLLRENPQLQKIPVIFVTALSDSDNEKRGLALGVADYITKPINIEIAKLRIRNLLERERLRKEIEFYRDRLAALVVERSQALEIAHDHEARLESIAYYDPLTGVPNRRLLMDRLNQAMAIAQRLKQMLAICYLDLDGFKAVNDQLGHDAGDQLLVEFTCRLKAILRQCDSIARLGGDEFVLLFGNIDKESECYTILERVLAATQMPFVLKNQTVTVSASIGVTFYPHDTATTDDLLTHADRAMYQAKQAGKNCFVTYAVSS